MSRFAAQAQTVDGYRFASKKEAKRYGELRLLERAGEIAELVVHPAFDVQIAGRHFCTYTADFAYRVRLSERTKENERIIEEVKSTGTRKDTAYRLRRKAAELAHGITVTEVVR